jgi:hypothetical protein
VARVKTSPLFEIALVLVRFDDGITAKINLDVDLFHTETRRWRSAHKEKAEAASEIQQVHTCQQLQISKVCGKRLEGGCELN